MITFITENDIVDHDNKKNPIIPSSYLYNKLFYCEENFQIDYTYEFIKYETDDGYFFSNYKNYTAVGFSEISLKKDYSSSYLGEIILHQSEKKYPYFKRSYKKVQSLLADIMSIINALIGVGKAISYFLLKKEMNKDIIRSILNRNINNEIIEHSLIENNRRKKRLLNDANSRRVITSDRKGINKNNNSTEISEISNNKDNSKNIFHSSKKDSFLEENKNINKKKIRNIHFLKKINIYDIIKSYFCFKDKKKNIINICNNFVMKDLCVERILERLYKLETIFNLLSKKELSKLKLYMDRKFSKISFYINEIYIEEKKKNNNKKEMLNKNKDNNILNK